MREWKGMRGWGESVLAGMNSSALDSEAPDLVCQLDNVQGMVDALTAVRWKRHQVIPLSPSPAPNFLFGSREKA